VSISAMLYSCECPGMRGQPKNMGNVFQINHLTMTIGLQLHWCS